MKYFRPDGTEDPDFQPKPGATAKDDYTSFPTRVRIYEEECGDEWPWHIDGVNGRGLYTEAVSRFESEAHALAALPGFVAEFFPNPPLEDDE